MKVLVLIIKFLFLFSIITINSNPIEKELSSLLLKGESVGIIKKINKILDMAYEDKMFSGFNLHLSEEEISNSKTLLLDDYKYSFKEFYNHLKQSETDEELKNALFSTITDIIEFYVSFNSDSKPKIHIGQGSAISLKTIENKHKVQTLQETRIESLREIPIEKKINLKELYSNKTKNLEKNKINNSHHLMNTDQVFLERFNRIKGQMKDPPIDRSQEYIEEFLKGQIGEIHTDILDYSKDIAFFPKVIFDQGNTNACYSASTSMLFSFYINIKLKRNNLALLKFPLEYADIAICSTYQKTFGITNEEKRDLAAFKYMNIFTNYKLNRGNQFGVVGPTAVWIKHHLDKIFYNHRPDRSYNMIPEHKHREHNRYSEKCLDNKQEYNKDIEEFSRDIEPIIEDLKKARIVSVKKAFNNMESLKNQLLNYGPFVFRIALSAKGERMMKEIVFTDAIITADMCNRFFNQISTVRHYLIAVGFGIRENKNYLKFKNSWGPKWGDNGYGYLEMDDAGLACNYKSSSQSILGTVAIIDS